MAGPIQKAMSDAITAGAAVAGITKKLTEDERQAEKEIASKGETQKEAPKSTPQAKELIDMGADPESAEAYVNAKERELDSKSFGMVRKQGKFVGSYSSLADKFSKDSLTDALSSRALNKDGFKKRKGLVADMKGGKRNG